jgi:hypothetical protein
MQHLPAKLLDLGSWDVSHVTGMTFMFSNANSIKRAIRYLDDDDEYARLFAFQTR